MVHCCKHAFRVVVDAEDETSRPRLHALAYATVPEMLLDDISALPQQTVYAVMHIENHVVVAADKNSVAAGISAAAGGGKKSVVAGKEADAGKEVVVVGAAASGKVVAAVVGAAVDTVEEVDPNYWRGERAL